MCRALYFLLFSHSVVSNSVTPWTVARQAPRSMGFPRQEHWSGVPFPSPGDLPDPGIEPASPVLAGGFFTPEPPGKPVLPTGIVTGTPHTLFTCVLFLSNPKARM